MYDIGYLHDGNVANGEITVNPDSGLPDYVELIFVQYSGAATTIHIDNVRLFTPTVLVPGDYNRNGEVDAADYTVWRDTFGSTSDLRADGSGPTPGTPDGLVNQLDYDFWKSNFGAGGSGKGGMAQSVPEPTSLVLGLLLTIAMAGIRCRWSKC